MIIVNLTEVFNRNKKEVHQKKTKYNNQRERKKGVQKRKHKYNNQSQRVFKRKNNQRERKKGDQKREHKYNKQLMIKNFLFIHSK